MQPIKFEGHNCVYAEHQPEYLPLPAYKREGLEGEVISCWKLNLKERLDVLFTGKIFLSLWTFNKPLQPQRLFTKLVR